MDETLTIFGELLIGISLAAPLLFYAHRLVPGRQIDLFGIALIITALIYVALAAFHWDETWLLIDLIGVPIYGLFYWFSIKRSHYWLAAGWALHPLWDTLLHLKGDGANTTPEWYAIACISFDLLVAAYIVLIPKEKA